MSLKFPPVLASNHITHASHLGNGNRRPWFPYLTCMSNTRHASHLLLPEHQMRGPCSPAAPFPGCTPGPALSGSIPSQSQACLSNPPDSPFPTLFSTENPTPSCHPIPPISLSPTLDSLPLLASFQLTVFMEPTINSLPSHLFSSPTILFIITWFNSLRESSDIWLLWKKAERACTIQGACTHHTSGHRRQDSDSVSLSMAKYMDTNTPGELGSLCQIWTMILTISPSQRNLRNMNVFFPWRVRDNF